MLKMINTSDIERGGQNHLTGLSGNIWYNGNAINPPSDSYTDNVFVFVSLSILLAGYSLFIVI
jgi:hypothetical protein